MSTYTGRIIFMGIDVHKNSYSVSVVCDGELIKRDTLVALPENLVTYCENFKGALIKSAYEAGFCGFHLHRILVKANIDNIVVHAASIEIGSRDEQAAHVSFLFEHATDVSPTTKVARPSRSGLTSCLNVC